VVAERFERLRVVVERSARARHAERVGRTESVLVEGPHQRAPLMETARTRQNKLVHVPVEVPHPPGTRLDVQITGAGAHHLRGDLLEVTGRPRRRRRIPVSAA